MQTPQNGRIFANAASHVSPRLIYSLNSSAVHDWPGHPETADRLASIGRDVSDVVEADPTLSLELPQDRISMASLEDVLLVHDERYLSVLRDKAQEAMSVSGIMLDESTYLTRSTYMDSMSSAGIVKAMIDEIMREFLNHMDCEKTNGDFVTPAGFALVRPPGHHACKAKPMGFCIVNNAAFATKYLQKEYNIGRVAIIDFDVHHGNGTQDLFYSDDTVLFLSTHMKGGFPGTGHVEDTGMGNAVGSTMNIELPGDAGHKAAMDCWDLMEAKITEFDPQFIVVSAGYDAHLFDPLGGLQYSTSTYYDLTRKIMELSTRLCQGKCLFVLEGGYHIDALAASVANSFRAILGAESVDPHSKDLFRDEPDDKVKQVLQEVRRIHEL
jgi:acetoin utilization deacetylase AcuC-like enzyme